MIILANHARPDVVVSHSGVVIKVAGLRLMLSEVEAVALADNLVDAIEARRFGLVDREENS